MVAVIAVVCIAVGLISDPKSKQESISIEAQDVSVKRLWENRTEYVGNNASVGNIVSELSFPDSMQYENFELRT